MRRRRAPRNSRLGCLQCKRRGVKCDEQRPICTRCENRIELCDYGSSGPWIWANTAVAGYASTRYQEVIFNGSSSSTDSRERDETSSDVSTSSTSIGGPSALLFSDDLDSSHDTLLRHWRNVTAPSISRNDSDRRIWQTLVSCEASSDQSLLHGVLGVTAIHLVLTDLPQHDQRKKWIGFAEYHQSKAITLFTSAVEKTSRLKHIGGFLLSSLLIGFAFAFPLAVAGPASKLLNPLEDIFEIIELIRSTMNFSAPMLTGAKSDELSQLTHVEATDSVLRGASCLAIIKLYELNTTHMLDPMDCQAFHRTISQLGDTLACIESGVEPVAKTFIWISEFPPRFHELLLQHHPFALVVFGHYCVALHRLNWLWWISSWGERVLVAIKKALDPEWVPSLNWALDMTGL